MAVDCERSESRRGDSPATPQELPKIDDLLEVKFTGMWYSGYVVAYVEGGHKIDMKPRRLNMSRTKWPTHSASSYSRATAAGFIWCYDDANSPMEFWLLTLERSILWQPDVGKSAMSVKKRQLVPKAPAQSSKFVGVALNKNSKWEASIVHDGVGKYIGVYKDEKDAARAYDHEARQLRGPKAHGGRYCALGRRSKLNFPTAAESKRALAAESNSNSTSKKSKTTKAATMGKDHRKSAKRPRTSAFTGIRLGKSGKWEVGITHEGNVHYLGVYADEQDAARAYDAEARRLRGPHAHGGESLATGRKPKLNFPTAAESKRALNLTPESNSTSKKCAATMGEGHARSVKRPRTSAFTGVRRLDVEKWNASITHDGKVHYLGVYNDEKLAACAYDEKARKLRGAKAHRLNFPTANEEEVAEQDMALIGMQQQIAGEQHDNSGVKGVVRWEDIVPPHQYARSAIWSRGFATKCRLPSRLKKYRLEPVTDGHTWNKKEMAAFSEANCMNVLKHPERLQTLVAIRMISDEGHHVLREARRRQDIAIQYEAVAKVRLVELTIIGEYCGDVKEESEEGIDTESAASNYEYRCGRLVCLNYQPPLHFTTNLYSLCLLQ